MTEESRPGVWETAILRKDGTILMEHLVIYEGDNQANSDETLIAGTPKYEEAIRRHPNLQVNVPHEIELPRKFQQSTVRDPKNFIDIKID